MGARNAGSTAEQAMPPRERVGDLATGGMKSHGLPGSAAGPDLSIEKGTIRISCGRVSRKHGQPAIILRGPAEAEEWELYQPLEAWLLSNNS